MIAHYPYFQNPAVYRMQGRRWAREWAHKLPRVSADDLPDVSVRQIQDHRIETDYLSGQDDLKAELFARGRYAVWRESDTGSGAFIDNTGAGWFVQPTTRNSPRIPAPVAETITIGAQEWGRLDVGTVAKIFTRLVGAVRLPSTQDDDDVDRIGLFALTGDGRVLAWGNDAVNVDGNVSFAIAESSELMRVPSGQWEDFEVAPCLVSAQHTDNSGYGLELASFAYAIRGAEVATWGRAAEWDVDLVSRYDYAGTRTFGAPVMAHDWRAQTWNGSGRVNVVLTSPESFQWVPVAILDDNRPVSLNPVVSFATGIPRYYAPPLILFPDIPTLLTEVDISGTTPDPNKFLP